VRVRIQDTLELRTDGTEGPQRTIPIDASFVVGRDGQVTTIDSEGTQTVDVSKKELEQLKEDVALLDLPALERRFGTQDEAGTITITYGGQTVILDRRVTGLDTGERDDSARRLFAVDHLLQDLSSLPLDDMRRQMEAAPDPTCGLAKRVVEQNARHLTPAEEREIYERVRNSDQPCP
jgi:hypothetical protein